MLKKILIRGFFILLALYAMLVIYRAFVLYGEDRTEEHVAKIHATKLSQGDVMGKNLPPLPSNPDATVAGVDANKNGIRDDVELAIFKAYPNSAKTRAVLLQYALAFQMEVLQPRINAGTVGAIANEQDRAFFCSAEIIENAAGEDAVILAVEKFGKFAQELQFNTEERRAAHKEFYSHLKSGTTGESHCDIDLKSLPN